MNRRIPVLILLLVLALAGCRRAEQQNLVPTLSPTPRSTALPPIPTEVPLGTADNPLQVVFVAPDADEASISAVEEVLSDETNASIEVVTVERPADALDALCLSPRGTVSAAWLDGLTALAAQAQGCATPTLSVERELSGELETTETIRLIGDADANIEQTSDLADGTFCRLGVTDLNSWLLPSLLLEANGVNPLEDLRAVEDYGDWEALIEAVAEGDCDGAGVPAYLVEDLPDELSEEIVILADASVDQVYGVLMYPQAAPLGIRQLLDAAFEALLTSATNAEALQSLLPASAFRAVDEDDFNSLTALIDQLNLDLGQLGR